MKIEKRHIIEWLACLLMLLMTACGGSDGEDKTETPPVVLPDPVLTFYVYAPERPMITRAGERYVDAKDAENAIHSLQIWVFETNTDNLVGYLAPTTFPTTEEGMVYQMNVSKEFANAASKPHVDVYVVANFGDTPKTQASLTDGTTLTPLTLNETTTRTQLEAALIGTGAFGLASPVIGFGAITEGGLPMTGVLRDQPVVGENPVLRIGDTYDNMAKVQLKRMVSKVRFVFAKATGPQAVSIQGITMNATMIPDVEYLFKTLDSFAPYNTTGAPLLTTPIDDIAETDDPTTFVYVDQAPQDYENLIDNAASKEAPEKPELTVHGPIYLRESDKQLAGTIKYKIGDDQLTADFQMKNPGEFLRNHTWIVYAYYAGSGKLQIHTLYVKDWSTITKSHSVYNW